MANLKAHRRSITHSLKVSNVASDILQVLKKGIKFKVIQNYINQIFLLWYKTAGVLKQTNVSIEQKRSFNNSVYALFER